jgi:hypothetical protein
VIVEIDHEVPMLEPSRPFRRRRRGAPEGGPDAGDELPDRERLRDVVVGTELEAADLSASEAAAVTMRSGRG